LLPEAKVATPLYRQRAWLAGGLQMLTLTGLSTVSGQVDLLVLGLFQSPHVVGTYAAAVRGAALVPLLLTMAITAFAPSFASLHAAGERAALQQLATRVSRLSLLGGLPVAASLLVIGRWYLGLYGPDFGQAQSALAILSLGQLANIAAGPVISLLTMTGHEREAIVGMACSAGANLMLSLLFIPRWGMIGAALAATTTLILWNVLLVAMVRQRLRISPTIFGARGERAGAPLG
jgi:O-antigen/teichoic acid export membrane protein